MESQALEPTAVLPAALEAEVGESRAQVLPELYSDFKIILGDSDSISSKM